MKSDKILNLIPILQQLDEKSIDLVTEIAKSYVPTLEEVARKLLQKDEAEKIITMSRQMDEKISEIRSKKGC